MANMLGHTRTVMLETYAAADPAAMKLAADMIGEAFGGEMEVYQLEGGQIGEFALPLRFFGGKADSHTFKSKY